MPKSFLTDIEELRRRVCSHFEYVEGEDVTDMIEADLVAERVAIGPHSEMVHYPREDGPTTRRVLGKILAREEEHAEDLLRVLNEALGTDDKSETRKL